MDVIALLYADAHNHSYKQFNVDEARTHKNTKLQAKIYKRAKKLKVPVLFAGDLFHNPKHLTNELLNIYLPALFKWHEKSHTYAISGNHDQSRQNIPGSPSPSYITLLDKIIPNFHCIDSRSIDLGPFVLHGIPYMTMNIGFMETMASFKLSKKKPNVLMVHTDLHGARDTNMREVKTVSIIPDNMAAVFKDFDLVISGHIHLHQELVPKQVLMLGAPMQQRKTDKGTDMGYWELYKDLSYKFVPLEGPEFIELEPDEKAPDDYHFYYSKPKPRTKLKIARNKGTKLKDNTRKLVKEYAKAEGIEDKDKITRLTKTLKEAR